jgi:hypothetical protein
MAVLAKPAQISSFFLLFVVKTTDIIVLWLYPLLNDINGGGKWLVLVITVST